MIQHRNQAEPVHPTEPSSQFLSLVMEIDEALYAGQPSELTETSLQQLPEVEREQLVQVHRRLQLLYARSRTSAPPKEELNSTLRDTADNAAEDDSDLQLGPDLRVYLGADCAKLGRFEIVRGLGMGGHGVVFLARDPVLNRQVALKLPRPDVLVHPSMRRRFLAEGQAAALLTHPNIVTVFESGEVGSICYLAQDYVAGPSLSRWLRKHPLPVEPQLAAALMLPLAEAVELAHSRRILHRDIKPGNILLAPKAGIHSPRELDDFEPKLADFGLAKLLRDQNQTRTGGALGTPAYMSPEQAAGRSSLMGDTSDVYSLGAVLYELLTHQPLYHGESDLDTLQQVLHRDPPRPCTITSTIPRDLEAICLKCLRRDPEDRYRSAQAFADDLRRYREGRPVLARPQSWADSISKWSRRNPAVATLAGLAAFAVLSALAVSVWYNARLNDSLQAVREQQKETEKHRKESETRELALRRRVYAYDMSRAATAYHLGKAAEVRHHLDAWIPQAGEPDLRTFAWWLIWNQLHNVSRVIGTFPEGATGAAVAVRQGRNVVATGEPDGVIRIRRLPGGELIGELRGHAALSINALDFSTRGAGALLASGGDDGLVRIWNVDDLAEQRVLRGHAGDVMAVRFLGPDSEALASGGVDGVIRIWDVRTGQLRSEMRGHTKTVRALVEQSATGALFSSAQDDTIRMWDWRNAIPHPRAKGGKLPNPTGSWARSLALEPDDTTVTAGFMNGELLRWDIRQDRDSDCTLLRADQLAPGIRTVVWQDERTVAVGFGDSNVKFVDTVTKMVPWSNHAGHTDWILGMDAVRGESGNDLVTISKDGTIRYWPRTSKDQVQVPVRGRNFGIAWSGSTLASRMEDDLLGFDVPSGELRLQHQIDEWPGNFWWGVSHDLTRILATMSVKRKNVFVARLVGRAGHNLFELPLPDELVFNEPQKGIVSPDSQFVFLVLNGEVWVVDLQTGERRHAIAHTSAVQGIAFWPQGNALITSCGDGIIRFWNIDTGELIESHPASRNAGERLAISRSGRLLASYSHDGFVRVWEIDDWREIAAFGADKALKMLDFVDDDQTLVGQDQDQLIFWSVRDQIQQMVWPVPDGVRCVVSPDQKTIAFQQDLSIQLLRGMP